MGMTDIDWFPEQREMDVGGVHRRLILAPAPMERVRWHAIWLLAQGWTAFATADELGREPHTIGRWLSALGVDGPTSSLAF